MGLLVFATHIPDRHRRLPGRLDDGRGRHQTGSRAPPHGSGAQGGAPWRRSMGLKLARDEMLSSVPAVHRLMLHWSWSVRLQERISQAGLTMKAGKLILISALPVPGHDGRSSGLFMPVFPVGILIGLCLGTVPYGVVMYLRQKRLRAFRRAVP